MDLLKVLEFLNPSHLKQKDQINNLSSSDFSVTDSGESQHFDNAPRKLISSSKLKKGTQQLL